VQSHAVDRWLPTRLGDVLKVKHGWPFKSEHIVEDTRPLPVVVNIGNFRYTGGFRFSETTVRRYDGPFPNEYVLRPDDILVVMTCQTAGGEILGIPGRIPDDGQSYLHNQRMGKVVITEPEQLDHSFAYWLFRSPALNRHLYVTASGTKILHTAPERIESYVFMRPPLEEQRAIAALLDALDDKIDLNRRMSETLEAMARALFKSWFVDFDPVRAKVGGEQPWSMDAATAALFPDAFEDSELGEIPQGWRAGRLSDVANVNERSIDKRYDHAAIDYIDIASVTRGRLDGTTRYALPDAPGRARRLVADGDTVWSCVRPNRRSYLLIQNPAADLVVSTGFAVLTPKDVGVSYLYLWTTTDDFVEYLTANADGSAYPAVRADRFEAARLLIPSDAVLDAFEGHVRPWLRRVDANVRECATLGELRDTLLPKLLFGEVRAT
jgi:type I restriction enzyme S subunit